MNSQVRSARAGSPRWWTRTADGRLLFGAQPVTCGDEEVDVGMDVARAEREGALHVHADQRRAQDAVHPLGQVVEHRGQQVRLTVAELRAQTRRHRGVHGVIVAGHEAKSQVFRTLRRQRVRRGA